MTTTAAFPPLVSASDLRRLLSSGEDLVVLDARRARPDLEAGILGARRADPDVHLSAASDPGADPAAGGRHPLPSIDAWARTLGAWGVSPASVVVAYDDESGANAAARAWWMLKSVGHDRAAVLDGGLEAAREAGLLAGGAAPPAAPKPPYPARAWRLPVADIADVDERRGDPAWRVLDVRSRPRFAGDVEPLDPVAGHIPGAVNLFFAENLSGGRFRPPEELRRLYTELLGPVPPERLIVHCGSGITACHTLLALDAAGIPGASLYVGGWSEWCRSGRPRAPLS